MNKKFFCLLIILIVSFGVVLGAINYANGEEDNILSPDDKKRVSETVEDMTAYDPQAPAYKANLYKLIIDAFERAGEWRGEMPRDEGMITVKRVFGAPKALVTDGKGGEAAPVDENATGKSGISTPPKYRTKDGTYELRYFEDINFPDLGEGSAIGKKDIAVKNLRILGAKIHFFKRGYNHFALYPPQPIYLEGITKGFELWVCGRNKNHKLYVMIEDVKGEDRLIEVGSLDFLGWKKLEARISPRVEQADYRFTQKRGITFKGFLVKCDPVDSYGKYYLYIDNFTVIVDRFFEENRDPYDPSDMW